MPDGNLHIRVNLKVKLEEKYPGVTRQLTGYVGHKNQVRNRHSCHTPCRRDCAAEYSQTLVSTKQCVQSFSGTTGDAFMQLDVEELELKLCDKLEEKMKGASLLLACFNWVKCATGKRLPEYTANAAISLVHESFCISRLLVEKRFDAVLNNRHKHREGIVVHKFLCR